MARNFRSSSPSPHGKQTRASFTREFCGTLPDATRLVFWSEEQYRLFGFAPDEFPASYDRFMASVHPDDRKRVRKWLKKLVVGHESTGIECRIILPNGETRLLHTLARTVLSITGKVVRIVGTS